MRRSFAKLGAAVANVADQIRQLAAAKLRVRPEVIAFLEEAIKQDQNVPFVARYRRHRTDGMNEGEVEKGFEMILELRTVFAAREKVLKDLTERNLMSNELRAMLLAATTMTQIESIYQPFRLTKTTNAAKGREKGLDKYSTALVRTRAPMPPEFHRLPADDMKLVQALVVEAMYLVPGAMVIVEERYGPSARMVTNFTPRGRKAGVKDMTDAEFKEKQQKYRVYDKRSFLCDNMEPHQILAVFRGEAAGFLKAAIECHPGIQQQARNAVMAGLPDVGWRLEHDPDRRNATFLQQCWLDAFENHYVGHAERLTRSVLKKRAERASLALFRRNLRRMLTQRPLRGHVLLAVDPGFAHGCKWAILSPTGDVITVGKFYLPKEDAKTCSLDFLKALQAAIQQHNVTRVAVGDGTASYETETAMSRMVHDDPALAARGIETCRCSEHGASIYSASQTAQEELGHLDLLYRSAVSIGRRVLDPLSELVKIPVQSLGVGMYQHDITERLLLKGLTEATMSTVGRIGVDVNTASPHVLSRVPGLSDKLAKALVLFRSTAGPFTSRNKLREVPGVTAATFEKFAGFVRVPSSKERLDDTNVHPETYAITRRLLTKASVDIAADSWADIAGKLQTAFDVKPLVQLAQAAPVVDVAEAMKRAAESGADLPALAPTHVGDEEEVVVDVPAATVERLAKELGAAPEQLAQILDALCAPRVDPRDHFPYAGLFHESQRSPATLKPGAQLYAKVENVVSFGAWIDIGAKDTAFMPAANLCDEDGHALNVSPATVLGPCDIVKCTVMDPSPTEGRITVRVHIPRAAVTNQASRRASQVGEKRERTAHVGAHGDDVEPAARRPPRAESPPPNSRHRFANTAPARARQYADSPPAPHRESQRAPHHRESQRVPVVAVPLNSDESEELRQLEAEMAEIKRREAALAQRQRELRDRASPKQPPVAVKPEAQSMRSGRWSAEQGSASGRRPHSSEREASSRHAERDRPSGYRSASQSPPRPAGMPLVAQNTRRDVSPAAASGRGWSGAGAGRTGPPIHQKGSDTRAPTGRGGPSRQEGFTDPPRKQARTESARSSTNRWTAGS
jgi:uncharacterized protein